MNLIRLKKLLVYKTGLLLFMVIWFLNRRVNYFNFYQFPKILKWHQRNPTESRKCKRNFDIMPLKEYRVSGTMQAFLCHNYNCTVRERKWFSCYRLKKCWNTVTSNGDSRVKRSDVNIILTFQRTGILCAYCMAWAVKYRL